MLTTDTTNTRPRSSSVEPTYHCPRCDSSEFEDAGVRTIPYDPTTGYGGDAYSLCRCLQCGNLFADEEIVVVLPETAAGGAR
jgi:hypothetical protein